MDSTNKPIAIIDVIAKPYMTGSKTICYYVVVDRAPTYVYRRDGNYLTAHDSGFYDFMQIDPGSRGAFAGRTFTIALTDGSQLECDGQVWSVGPIGDIDAVQVGVATLEQLEHCYCFLGGYVLREKLQAWLAVNKPSADYYKYDPRETLAWQDALYRDHPGLDTTVSPKRARTLRQRGVTIRRHPVTGRPGWSKSYERKKAAILARQEAA
ncbi:hypothetical protein [Massilia phyllosphaerae]|uniref:hypothetical protein n=1 Tax=Massilia phyllosphaerae TaxID=3106034 RepID=UPI002B1CD87F|nr:hypothetical protein [Massilia sp. SGZ-792]